MQITGTGYEFGHADDYQRMLPLLKDGTVIYDDATEHEMEELVRYLKPGMVGAGIKEKYVFQKMGLTAMKDKPIHAEPAVNSRLTKDTSLVARKADGYRLERSEGFYEARGMTSPTRMILSSSRVIA